MPTSFTEGRHPGEAILSEANFHRSRDTIVIASGSGVIAPNTVLAKLDATGRYKPSTATGADGGQTAIAVNIYGVDATSADVPVAAITRDAEIKAYALTYDATVNDDAKKLAKRTQLAAVGIISR
jgi:hypothetical protein